MGNPLAPTLANFFLGHMENQLFGESSDGKEHYPAFYCRYVDDIFCIFHKDVNYEIFFRKLNALHRNLTFTVEMGGKSLSFLDTKITLHCSSLDSTFFRKDTNNNVIMNYSSVAPKQWKVGLIKFFLSRAYRVCSDSKLLQEEVNELRNIFFKNGYPNAFFDNVADNYLKQKELTERKKTSNGGRTRCKGSGLSGKIST